MKDILIKIGIFVAIIVLQIGLAYGLVTYILPSNKAPDLTATPDNTETTLFDGGGKAFSDSTQSGNIGTEKDSLNEAEFYNELSDYLEEEIPKEDLKNAVALELNDLIINPAKTRGTRYIVMSINLVINGKDVEAKWEAKMPAIRDAVNTLVARKTVLWLSDIDNRPYLREEIKLMLESILGDAKVLRVYFTKYLFQ